MSILGKAAWGGAKMAGRGVRRAGAITGLALADTAGAMPLLGAAGVVGAGIKKGMGMFGSGGGKDPKVDAITPLAGDSSADAVTEVLKKIMIDTSVIHDVLKAGEVPESEKKEIALDAEVRHRELLEAIMAGKPKKGGGEEKKGSIWDKMKKWMSWILNLKTWVKHLMGSLIVRSLLGFMIRVGAFLLSPVGLALIAVLVVATNWPDIKNTVREFVQNVKDYVQAIMDATGISALIDLFSEGATEVDDFAAMPVEMDDPVGDAEFEEVEDDNVFGSDEEADKFLDDVMAGKKPDKESEVTGNVFGSSEGADKFLDDVMQGKSTEKVIVGASVFGSSESADAFLEDTKVQPQTKMTGTMGEGGVSMQIPTMAALSRSFQGSDKRMTGTQGEGGVSMQIPTMAALSRAFQAKEEPEPLSEEEQFKKDARAKGASEEAIASAVRRKFRSEWEQSLTPDEERKQAKMEEAGASEKAIKHSIQMDRSAREKGFKNQAEYLASIPEKGEKKQDATMWVLPKDDTPQTYNEGWQVNKGGGWEDVADQKVPTIMGEKGLSTLSHVKYRQKEGGQQQQQQTASSSTNAAASLNFLKPSKSESGGVGGALSDGLSIMSSVFPSVTANVQTGGNQVQLGLSVAGAGRLGNRVITVTTNTNSSSTFGTNSTTKSITQQGMSINNNHTQPPQTGRDA